MLVENRRVNIPHLYLPPPPVRGDPIKILPRFFGINFWHKKLEFLGVVCIVLCLAVLVQCRLVTDIRRRQVPS